MPPSSTELVEVMREGQSSLVGREAQVVDILAVLASPLLAQIVLGFFIILVLSAAYVLFGLVLFAIIGYK